MAVKKEQTLRIEHSAQSILTAAADLLASMGANIAQQTADTLIAQTATTMRSYGEVIRVQVQSSDAKGSTVYISSESAVASTMFDWGKNDENVKTLAHRLPQALGLMAPDGGLDDDDLFPELAQQPAPAKTAPPPAQPTPKATKQHNIFISYRRADSIDIVGRIYDKLIGHFGREGVFKDVDAIPLGVDFRTYLQQTLSKTTAVLVVIGPQWVSIVDEDGQQRLHDENDWVRVEVEQALGRDIPVVPLLVYNARMPKAEQLPTSLQSLAARNGLAIRPDPDFHNDMDRLIRGLEG